MPPLHQAPTVRWADVPSPCYVLEEKRLRENLARLAHVQEAAGCQIICALKGYAMWSTFPILREYLPGTTASSLYEARLAHEEFGGEVHAYATVYFEDEFEELTRYCGHITFNSLSQWERFKDRFPAHCSAGLRINPEYSEVDVDLYNPTLPGTRFGITADALAKYGLPEGIEGLHFHTLCEQNADALERTLAVVEERFAPWLHGLKWFNMGGGHHITREDYEIDRLIARLRRFSEKYQVQVILEPGEAIGLQTGYLVSRVEDILDSGGILVAMLDVSFTAHMPDCLEMPYKPRILGASNAQPDSQYVYRMGGTTCLSGDFMGMGDYAFAQPLQVGDLIVFDDMIHYTMVKTSNFNGVKHPSIGIWTTENKFELVKSFGYQMYRDRLS
ncbi:MAG: carboxynorspermidine decarboxylase [Bernardetiaceae bacterium]